RPGVELQVQLRVLAFVLAAGRAPVYLDLGEAGPVERAVAVWRDDAVRGRSPDTAGAELRRRLWRPLLPHLKGAGAVLIAPDRVLCALPFAALPGQKEGSFLVEEGPAIGYVTSGRRLLELKAQA